MAPPKGLKTVLSVGSLAIVAFPAPTPTLLWAPPHPLGPEGADFSGPPPPGTMWALAVGFRGTEEFFVSCGSGQLCCAHTSPHDGQGLPFSASFSCPCARCPLPWCPQPRGPPAAPLPLCGWGDLEPWGSCYFPSHIGGGFYRGFIPVGTGAIRSDPPSLLLSEELASLAGSFGQEPPWQQQ